jgi:phage terminase large subunit-like protein
LLEADPRVKLEIEKRARIELAKRAAKRGDVLEWGAALFPDKFNIDFCYEMHQYFVDIMYEPFTNTEAPRKFSKTTIKCFLIPLFIALNHPRRFNHFLNVQSTSTKSVSENMAIRLELETNQELIYLYGNQITATKWTEKQFELKNGVIFSAAGIGESIRGYSWKNKRPDYIICDDLYDEEDINNIESTEKKTSWFWGTLYPALDDTKESCLHIQGTAINKADLLNVLKKNKNVISRTFRAVDYTKKTSLWSELFSYENLMEKKYNMGSLIFAREYQNDRRSEDESIIKESWLKFYDGNIPGDEIIVANIGGNDPSIGEKVKSDYTGTARVIKTRLKDSDSNRWYIKEVRNEHLTMDGRISQLRTMNESEAFSEVRVEGISGFKDYANQVIKQTNIHVNIIDHVKDKITNKVNKSGHFENGRVFINQNIPDKLKAELIEQLTNNNPTHDDISDSVLLCIDSVQKEIRFSVY